MRVLHINEDDHLLFGNELSPDHFKFYLQHRDAFTQMWKEQGTGFWLRFLISLRSFMKRRKQFVVNADDEEMKKKVLRGVEDAYCKILDDLTANSCSALRNLMSNVAMVSENRHNLINITQKSVVNDPFYSRISRSAFRDLFGDPSSKETFILMCDKLMVFLHAAGSLCVLLKRWTTTKEVAMHVRNIPWNPPACWDDLSLLNVFEYNLKQQFGENLFDLIGVNKKYDWVAALSLAEEEIKKKFVERVANGTKKVLPWKPLDRDWTEKRLGSTDICFHLTKYVWSTYWHTLSEIAPNLSMGSNVFSDNDREQCAVQIGVSMYHHLFGPNFFAFLYKQINNLKMQLDDETLKELEHYSWMGKKCGVSKSKWNEIISSHQLLEKIIPVFQNRTDKMINFTEDNEFCVFPVLDQDFCAMLTAWHLPLAKDYLDHALCWIAYIEELMAPLTVFPLLKELQQPLERLLIVFHQAKCYVQVCLEYVDELDRLYGTGDFNWLSAVEYHETIQDIISKLWLNDWLSDALTNLQEILNIAWSKQELKDGITSNPNRHRIYAKFLNLEACPSIETLFCDNPRHFAYWIPTIPELDKKNNNFMEVQLIWKELCSKMEKGNHHNWNPKIKEWSSINKALTSEENIMFERMNWNPASLEDCVDDVKEALTLIKADGEISNVMVSKMEAWLKSVKLLYKSNKLSPVLEKNMANLKFLHKHACLYMLGKSAILATEKIHTTERAIFVSSLLQQITKLIAVSCSKFVCVTQVVVTENERFVPCPSKKWFDKITSFLNEFAPTLPTGNLKMVNNNLEKLLKQFWDKKLLENDAEEDKKVNENGSSDYNVTKETKFHNNDNAVKGSEKNVDTLDKIISEEAEKYEEDNHDIFYVKWQELVTKVVNNCYQLSAAYRQQGGTVSCRQFPHWHTLLFFMREEIGYFGAYLEYSDTGNSEEEIEEAFKKKLMDYRLSWMEKEIEKWCAGSSLEKGSKPLSSLSVDSATLMQQHAVAQVRIVFCDVIIKSCVAKTLGITTSAFTNIRNVTIDELNKWSFFMLSLVANDPAFWMDMPVLMVNFTSFLKIFADYTETYKDHILGLDGGNFYEKWQLDKSWVPDSVEHYRVATLAFLRFNLISFYSFILMELPLLTNLHFDHFIQIFTNIAKCFCCFASDDFMFDIMPGGMSEAKTRLHTLWQDTKALQPPSKKDVHILSQLPEYIVGDKSWRPLMENYVTGRFDAVAAKLALSGSKPSTNTPPKNLNKIKKKQTPLKLVYKGEVKIVKNDVSISMSKADSSCNGGGISVGDPCCPLPVPGKGARIDNACNGSPDKESFQPSSVASVNHVIGKVSTNGVEKGGKEVPMKSKAVNTIKHDPGSEKDKDGNKAICVPIEKSSTSPVPSTENHNLKNAAPGKDTKTLSSTDIVVGPSKSSVKVKALHTCAYCKSMEPSARVYMKCALCKQHNFRPPMFYCGQVCHAKHWNEGHREQHAAFSGTK